MRQQSWGEAVVARLGRSGRYHARGCILAAAVLSHGYGPAMASDAIFTVGNYPVDSRADNAVTAKSQAIADGQRAALKSLLKRMVPVTEFTRLRRIKLPKSDAVLSGISVRSERNSTTEYIANLDFQFRPDAVRALLERERLPYVDTPSPQITVVPVWLADEQPIPGVAAEAWHSAWSNVDLAHALTPARLELMKAGVHRDTIAALAKGDATMLRTFAGEYSNAERMVVAILSPVPKERKFLVTLIGRDAVGSIAWTKGYRFEADDPGYAIELAAVVSLGVLEGRWKASGARVQGPIRTPGTDPAAATPTISAAVVGSDEAQLRLSVEFASMGEWQEISRKLGQVPGVSDVDVLGLSGRSARLILKYADGAQQLAQSVGQYGLAMRQNAGGWVLSRQ